MTPEKIPTGGPPGPASHQLRMAGRCAADTARHSGQPGTTRVWESVRARMPTPEEQHELGLNAAVPVLVLTRRTQPRHGHADEQATEDLVLPADQVVLDYVIDLDICTGLDERPAVGTVNP